MIELLIIVILVPAVMTKWVQDNRTDRAYAEQGMVSPRYQERLAKLEAAGRPNSRKVAKERGPLRNYLGELYADTVNDMGEKRRARRAARAPFDPTSTTVGQRAKAAVAKAADGFDARALRVIDGWKQSKGWDSAKTAAKDVGRKFMGPVEEKPAEPASLEEQVAEEPAAPAAPVREDDNAGWFDPAHLSGHADEDMLVRTGGCPYLVVAGWDPPHYCSVNRSPNEGDHPYCRAHAASIRDDRGRGSYVAPAGDVDEHLPLEPANPTRTPTPSTGGTAMTAPTGEAVNYETTVSELEALAREQRGHIDHCQQALKSLEQAKASINNMQESYRQSSAAAAATSEHLAAKNLDGTTLAHAGATADAMPAGKVDQMYDQLEGMEAEAKARLSDAEVALGSTEANLAHVQATYSAAHETVAGQLGGDASFLDSGGGAGAGAGSAGAFGGGPSGTGGGGIWAGDEGVTVSGRAFGPGATTTTGGAAAPPSRRVGAPSGDRSGGFNGISSTGGGPVNVTGSAMGDNVTVNNG